MSNFPPEPRIFAGHFGTISALSISSDSRLLASSSYDGTARIWDIATGDMRIIHNTNIPEFSFFSLNQAYHLLDASFSPDGRLVVIAGYNSPHFWNVQTGELYRTWQVEGDGYRSAVFLPDSRALLAGDRYSASSVELRDAQTGELLRTFPETRLFKGAVSPDGQTFLTGSWTNTVHLRSIASGETIRTFSGHTDLVICAAFSPDSRQILTGSNDATARLWDAQTGDVIHTFERHYRDVHDVAFSPDGQSAITCSRDESLRFWKIETGEDIGRLTHRKFAVDCARFTPDSRYIIVAAPPEIQVWQNPLAGT